MFYLVSVDQMPPSFTFMNMFYQLRDVKKKNTTIFWIREMEENLETNTKRVNLEVYKKDDAERIVTLLNNKTVSVDGKEYTLKSSIDSTCEMQSSHNPKFNSSILAGNKYNSISEYFFDNDNDKDYYKTTTCQYLPKFNEPRRLILQEMESLLQKLAHNQPPLYSRVLNDQLRLRITKCLQGKPKTLVECMKPEDIVKQYRARYNQASDIHLVRDCLKLLKEAIWPSSETMKGGFYMEELALGSAVPDRILKSDTKLLNEDKIAGRDVEDGIEEQDMADDMWMNTEGVSDWI